MAEDDTSWITPTVPARLTSLVLLGLRVAGYNLLEEQVSDQPVDRVAQTCAAADAVTQGAVQSYLGLLLSVLERPDVWGIESSDLPDQIERHGASWYQRALESAQRQARKRAESEQWERKFGPPVAGHRLVGHPGPPLSRQDLTDLQIDETLASGLADMLLSAGYHLAPEQLAGRHADAVAHICEPDDPVKRQLILMGIYSYSQNRRRQAEMLERLQESLRRSKPPDEGDSSSDATAM